MKFHLWWNNPGLRNASMGSYRAMWVTTGWVALAGIVFIGGGFLVGWMVERGVADNYPMLFYPLVVVWLGVFGWLSYHWWSAMGSEANAVGAFQTKLKQDNQKLQQQDP